MATIRVENIPAIKDGIGLVKVGAGAYTVNCDVLRLIPGNYVSTTAYAPAKTYRKLACEYCGCISEKDHGTCEHCGAPLKYVD